MAAATGDAPAGWAGLRRGAGFVLAGAALYLVAAAVLYAGKALSHDDIALYETARAFDPVRWLTLGYSEFFDAPGYHFIRPVSQLMMHLNGRLFGEAYGLYFLPYFLILGAGAGAAASLGRSLGLGPALALLAGAVVLLQPAVYGTALLFVSFQQDTIAGVLCLGAALALLHRVWWAAVLLLTLAVFTKEVALFAPVSAALWALLVARRPAAALALLLPLALWAGARVWATGSVAGDAYTLARGLGGLVRGMARGLAIWPTGGPEIDTVKALVFGLRDGDPAVLAERPLAALRIGLNLALDALIALGVIGIAWRWQAARRHPADDGERRAREAETLVALFALGAMGLLMLQAYHVRFAGVLHPFLALLILRLAVAPPWPAALLRPAATALGLAFLSVGLAASAEAFRAAARDTEPAALAALRAAVEAEPPRPGGRILVAHAPVTGSVPRWIRRHWERPEELVFLDNFFRCRRAPDAPAPEIARQGDELRLSLGYPPCATMLLHWSTSRVAVARERGAVRELADGTAIHYALPEARVVTGVGAGATPDIDLGRRIEARFPAGAFDRILVLDWESGRYVPLAVPAGP